MPVSVVVCALRADTDRPTLFGDCLLDSLSHRPCRLAWVSLLGGTLNPNRTRRSA
jgi:hypothetical protein